MVQKLEWIDFAKTYIGTKEVPGKANNPVITNWLIKLKAWWTDDATPWCGVFVAHVLSHCDRKIPKDWFRALAWKEPYVTKLNRPAYGCVVTFGRKGGGHVGFVVGKDTRGRLLVLGGNQGDEVNIRAFDPARVVGYYWPIRNGSESGYPNEDRYDLKNIDASKFKLSTNEA